MAVTVGKRGLLTVDGLSKYLGVSRYTIYDWVSHNKLPFAYIKFERGIRFDPDDVDKWLETRKIQPVNSFYNLENNH